MIYPITVTALPRCYVALPHAFVDLKTRYAVILPHALLTTLVIAFTLVVVHLLLFSYYPVVRLVRCQPSFAFLIEPRLPLPFDCRLLIVDYVICLVIPPHIWLDYPTIYTVGYSYGLRSRLPVVDYGVLIGGCYVDDTPTCHPTCNLLCPLVDSLILPLLWPSFPFVVVEFCSPFQT